MKGLHVSLALDVPREMYLFLSLCSLLKTKTLFPLGSAVYTPGDGDNWLMAKLNVQITDIGYAQIAEHLARVTTTIRNKRS